MIVQQVRLALRVEGPWWVAYYAKAETMQHAIRLGSILLALVQDPVHKEAFMQLMQSAVASMLEQGSRGPVEWDAPVRGPEHERSGNA